VPKDPRIPPIELAIETSADATTAWRHLTEPALVATWLAEASSPGPVGAPYRLDFGDGSVVTGRVLAVEPGTRFSYGWSWEGADTSEANRVTWTVEPRAGGGSLVRLVHDGWTEAGADATVRDEHESYWSGYLDDLRDILDDA
jgi:uncharacterized protein YndB with AHSA1/START domain